MTIHINAGLKLFMESAIAAPTTVTAITKAAPGVLSAAGHTFANGDVVLLEIQGMSELHGRLFKVVNVVATTSFQISGIDGATGVDTTLYNTRNGYTNWELSADRANAARRTLMAGGPMLVAAELPQGNPIKAVAEGYVKAYEGKYGAGSMSTFGANTFDAGLLLQKAIPQALAKARPGSAEFRAALRDALEQSREVVGAQGIFNMSPQNHNGMDQRARVMMTVKGGKWTLVQ